MISSAAAAIRRYSLALGAFIGLGATAVAQTALSPEETYALARDAYLFAYPIVSMDVTMRQATNVPDAATVNLRAPVNQFAHARAYPKADEKDVVRYNFDTLYSMAWLDLSSEPLILSVPDTQGRYYLLPMLDMWTDVFSVVGSRTTGTKAANYAIVGPDWRGALPAGVEKIVAPTPAIWILGRTKTDGPADYDNVHKVQDGYRLTPLSRWGKAYAPPKSLPTDPSIDDKTPPLVQVNKLDGVAMLTRLADLMVKYPPHPNDYPILFRLRQLGLEPGKSFDASKLDPQIKSIVNKAAKDTITAMPVKMLTMTPAENGWNIGREHMGTYGTAYQWRALIALGGLGANLPEDAVYPTAFTDGEGKPLNGANKYLLHFAKGQTPPANAFWSITMYDKDGFQVPNPIDRYAIGSYDKLEYNTDGSIDIYVQADSPGKGKEANWLPAPRAAFQPTMRLYSPRREVLDGSWSPPPLKRVN
ncbi:DUF1254 domain-containing protein [Methylocystis parvus]|uniref:DUF1254 domain-containing protein n=1 Tax=Methylocystis parvus TaxID=134 RepID=A0A6B8MHD9_9HYPH|nr:DUF1254 domain-containing protein [Methylocystis parvus]QGN00061.1 DUF1254 domain-containing protein [Methylocystis parvus]WBK02440.1 DUF1254 domain-containing protein [Methylocystis parvus OBBP]